MKRESARPRRATACLWAASALLGIDVADRASAQAWTRDAGSGYAQLAVRRISARSLYGPDGTVRPLPDRFRQHALSTYAEVGVVDRWLTVAVDHESLRVAGIGDTRTVGTGDLRVSMFTGLVTRPLRLAVGASLGLPTGDTSPPNRGTSGASGAVLPTGDGEWDVALRVVLGHSFGHGARRWPLTHFVQAELGYWIRTRGFVDQLVYRVEFGMRPRRAGWDRLFVLLRVAGLEALRAPGANAGLVGLGDGVSVLSFGPEAAVRLGGNVHLVFGVDGALRAELVPAALQYKVGLAYSGPFRSAPDP